MGPPPPPNERPATPPASLRRASPTKRLASPTHRPVSPTRGAPPLSAVIPPNALRPLTPVPRSPARPGSPARVPIATAPSRGASVGSTIARVYGSHRDEAVVPTVDGTRFRLGRPSLSGTITPCFKRGLLYRIVRGDQWSFYNDTQEYEMHVRYQFGCDSSLRPLPGATLAREGDQWVITTVVYPGDTQPFMEGQYSGYHSVFRARPLSAEYRQRVFDKYHRKAEAELTYEMQCVIGPAAQDPEAVLAAMLRAWKPFVDPSFRPSPASQYRHIDGRTLPIVPWLRPEDYVSQGDLDRITVGASVRPVEVEVGHLGDSWVTSALAALAERPELVRRLLQHPLSEDLATRERAVGGYHVWVNKGGWWRPCLIDNYLPCIGNRPFYASCTNPLELWPSLLQKAYAKVHGSYAAIIGGDVLQALQDFTGFPTTRFDSTWGIARADEGNTHEMTMFEYIQQCIGHRSIVVLNTPPTDLTSHELQQQRVQRLYTVAGLQQGYAYSVLNAKSFPHHNIRLVQIRNPWYYLSDPGTGPWSNHDELWTRYPDIAAECASHDPSATWMSWRDALDLFDGGGVCHVREGWGGFNIRGEFINGVPSVALEVVVAAPTRAILTLSQTDRRGLPLDDPHTHYAAVMLSVCRAEGSRYVVDRNSSADTVAPTEEMAFNFARDVSMSYTFDPDSGPFYVVPRVYAGASKSFVLTLLMEGGRGKGLSVTMRRLDARCEVFGNMPSFTVNAPPAVETDVQKVVEGSCFEVKTTAL